MLEVTSSTELKEYVIFYYFYNVSLYDRFCTYVNHLWDLGLKKAAFLFLGIFKCFLCRGSNEQLISKLLKKFSRLFKSSSISFRCRGYTVPCFRNKCATRVIVFRRLWQLTISFSTFIEISIECLVSFFKTF